jgi:hypothetical protein
MKSQFVRILAGAGGAALLATPLILQAAESAASASVPGSVPFSQANFHGYASGTEVHASVITVGTTTLANADQAFSGASTNTAGLTTKINAETGSIVQPAEPASVNAYGTGTGLEVGLGTSTVAGKDPNQILLAGKAESIAPPNTAAVTKQIGPINLQPLVTAAALVGRAGSIYSASQCPIGQPISYGLGDAAGVNALFAGGTPVVGLTGVGTSVAQSDSETFLSANGDGSFGLTTQARNIIAPITVTIPGAGVLTVTVNGSTPNEPVTLDAVTTGKSSGAAVQLLNFHTVAIKLVLAGTTVFNQTIDISSLLTPLDHVTIPGVATLDIDTKPHAIGGAATSSATTTGGTAAAGAVDLLHLQLLPGTLNALNLFVGHLEASANLASSIDCGIPIIKTSDPTSVTAGNPFTYNIQVPDPAQAALIACNLNDITVVDTITDKPGTSAPTFHVDSVSAVVPSYGSSGKLVETTLNNTATIVQPATAGNTATVTWKGLSWPLPPAVGDPVTPPIALAIHVSVPSTSPAGTIEDTVNAVGVTAGCSGGVSGITNIGGANGTTLTGTFTLLQPSVGATTSPAAAKLPARLPFTGAMGGLWQPMAGVAVLGLGGGALALVRRSRRRLPS